jgi:hypothetical protein
LEAGSLLRLHIFLDKSVIETSPTNGSAIDFFSRSRQQGQGEEARISRRGAGEDDVESHRLPGQLPQLMVAPFDARVE